MKFNQKLVADVVYNVLGVCDDCKGIEINHKYKAYNFYSAYFHYPFDIDIVYKGSKYKKRTIEKQQDNVFFLFPKEITVIILQFLNFSDMKNLLTTSVAFYKLVASPIGEMALRHKFINNKTAITYDEKLCGTTDLYPPSNMNKRYWWCKTKNIIAYFKFCKFIDEHSPDVRLRQHYFIEIVNFKSSNELDIKRYMRGDDINLYHEKTCINSVSTEGFINSVLTEGFIDIATKFLKWDVSKKGPNSRYYCECDYPSDDGW